MSVLRNRILGQPTHPGPGYTHPVGTSATPMVMPLALVDYRGGAGVYQDLHAVATGDPNAVPMAVVAPGSFGKVAAAGRP